MGDTNSTEGHNSFFTTETRDTEKSGEGGTLGLIQTLLPSKCGHAGTAHILGEHLHDPTSLFVDILFYKSFFQYQGDNEATPY